MSTIGEPWQDAVVFPPALLLSFLHDLQPRRILLLGDVGTPDVPTGTDVRRIVGGAVPLDIGLGFNDREQGWTIIVGATGSRTASVRWLNLTTADNNDPAVAARGLFDFLWPVATDAGSPPKFSIGSTVRRQGETSVGLCRPS